MNDKQQLRKNKLDLEYHGESQKANAYLILITTGVLAFIGTFIWITEDPFFYLGFFITVFISLLGFWFYRRSIKRMKYILREIENII